MNEELSIMNEVIETGLAHTTDELISMISMEEDSVSLEGLIGDLTLGISDSLTSSMTSLRKGISVAVPFMYSKSSELTKVSEKYPFMDIGSLLLTTPESFKGYMLEYMESLNDIHRRHKSNIVPTLKKHKKKLLTLLTNGSYETNIHYSKDFKTNSLTLSKDKALYNSYYPRNNGSQKAKVSDLFGNWGEIIDLHNLVNNKKSVKITTKDELDGIIKAVGEVNEILLRVRDEIRSDNSKKRTRTLKDIASGIYTLAQEVDFFSTMVFELHVAMELTKSNEDKLLEYKGGK